MSVAPSSMIREVVGNEGEIVQQQVFFKDFLAFINQKIFEEDKKSFPNLCKDDAGNEAPYAVLELEYGRKYVRIVMVHPRGGGRSAWAFLDYKGNIYKTASWKAPAKHVRGTVFDKDYSWGKALGRYGAAYLR